MSTMIEFNVIQSGRREGKTHTIMTEIHEWIVAGRLAEILIVFPAQNWVYWWTREWQSRFPYVPMPKYVTLTNTMSVRGARFSKIYVEDVDGIESGIYNPKLLDIYPCLLSPLGDEEVIFTCSPLELNQRSHNAETSKKMAMDKAAARIREKRRKKELEDEIMVAHMQAYIETHSEQ